MPTAAEPAIAELRKAIELELHAGEQVTWLGVPAPDVVARNNLGQCLFGLMFVVIPLMSLKSMFGGTSANSGATFALVFQIPFLAIGLYQLSAPWRAYLRARHTVHVVTNERVLTITKGPFAKTESYWPKDIKGVERRDFADGRGTLTLDRGMHSDGEGQSRLTEKWYGVADPRGAEVAVRDLLRQSA